MDKKNYVHLVILIAILLLLFHPLFYSEYAYTDENVQLWLYKKGSDFHMFISQGRYITDRIFQALFSSVTTIKELKYLRLFSLAGWIVCLPVWYLLIKKVIEQEKAPQELLFLSLLYLITCPTFIVSVSWASCMELFLANTCGLVSGYILYNGIYYTGDRVAVSTKAFLLCLLFGIISLFTYQNGFGCFFIPFLIHFLSRKSFTKTLGIGISLSLVAIVVYFFLFKYSLRVNNIVPIDRTDIHLDPLGKLKFFVGRPLASAFHFTLLFHESSRRGILIYGLLLLTWLVLFLKKEKSDPLSKTIVNVVILFALLLLVYLPSLIVVENYSSNRTLLALNMAVFYIFFHTLFHYCKGKKASLFLTSSIALFFIACAGYNFNKSFLSPRINEYRIVRTFIEKNYTADIREVYFVRPPEDLLKRKYGIPASWDEFGVPSTFFEWVPEFFTKQIVFEKTGNRKLADSLLIKTWLTGQDSLQPPQPFAKNILLINGPQLLEEGLNKP